MKLNDKIYKTVVLIFYVSFYRHKRIVTFKTKSKMTTKEAPPLLNWMRDGMPARFQDPMENIREDLLDLTVAMSQNQHPPPLHPVSPLNLPANATIKLHNNNNNIPPPPRLERQNHMTIYESHTLTLLQQISREVGLIHETQKNILSTVYANNHALRDKLNEQTKNTAKRQRKGEKKDKI
jgi:hypothetical protein